MNLPNALTLLRIFLALLVGLVLTSRGEHTLLLGTLAFGLAVLTDCLDGYLARRRNQVTPLGVMLDPIADKLLTAVAFVSLVHLELAPLWMVVVILGRELAVTGLRFVAWARDVLIPASPLGKGKMASQVVAIFLLLLSRPLPPLEPLARGALWVVVVLALLSGLDYFRRFGSELLRAPVRRQPAGAASSIRPS